MDHLLLILVCFGLLCGLTFTVQLGRRDWRSSPAGVSTMLLSVVIDATLTLAVVRYAGLQLPDWVRVVVFVAIDVALLGRVIAYVATARASANDQRYSKHL